MSQFPRGPALLWMKVQSCRNEGSPHGVGEGAAGTDPPPLHAHACGKEVTGQNTH